VRCGAGAVREFWFTVANTIVLHCGGIANWDNVASGLCVLRRAVGIIPSTQTEMLVNEMNKQNTQLSKQIPMTFRISSTFGWLVLLGFTIVSQRIFTGLLQ
jgi:hypothetical protein